MSSFNPGQYTSRGCKAFKVRVVRQMEGGSLPEQSMEVNARNEKHAREMLSKYGYSVLSIRCVETFR